MMNDWEAFKLKEVCEIRPPKRETKELLNDSDLVSFVPMSQLNEERKDFNEEESKTLKSVYKGYTYFKDGDVLLAKITPCFENGKMGIANELTNGVGFGSSEFIVYRPDSRLIREYLFYFLLLPKFRTQGEKMMGGAVGHQRIPKEFYEDFEIPIPPLPEQKRIVEILDEAFEAIDQARANVERNIENAEELFQSKLDSFRFNKTKLENIVDIKTGKLNANQAVEDGKYAFFTCSRETYRIDKYSYDYEAILLAGNNASGDFNVKHFKGKFDAYQRTYIITVKDESNLDYRFLYFQIYNSLKKLKRESIGTATRYLKMSILNNLEIAFPDIIDQENYVKTMDGLLETKNEIILNYKNKLSALEELKKSILQKAFSGELTANEHVAV